MTDLERKLAETLREQGEEVTPNLDAAWAEQQRRQRRPRRRRAAVWVAPLAAVLVVLTSVLLTTQLQTPSTPSATPGAVLHLPQPQFVPMSELLGLSSAVALTEFAGQTDRWRAWAFPAQRQSTTSQRYLCVAATPADKSFDRTLPEYGTKSPQCVVIAPIGTKAVLAGYVGEAGGPLPPGKAVYLLESTSNDLRLYDARGDLSQGKWIGRVWNSYQLFLADVNPDSPPVRAEVS
ncbi:hypothetical protein ACGFMK_09425 [Amycolatopsis sp. NPDC049252]|uniref:hypothetical protein n=1 Tax=Amycolatopsis sp. NPDC049252 TaxID=3363933 RepID=UPI003720AB54